MKKILFIYSLFVTVLLSAEIGCYRLSHYGEHRFVQCLCSCTKSHPTCIWCGHYHEAPDRQIIINPQLTPSTTSCLKPPLDMQTALKNIVQNYYKKHQ